MTFQSIDDFKKLPLLQNKTSGFLSHRHARMSTRTGSSTSCILSYNRQTYLRSYTQKDIDIWKEVYGRMSRHSRSCPMTYFNILDTVYTGALGFHYGAEKLELWLSHREEVSQIDSFMLMEDAHTTVFKHSILCLYLAERVKRKA